MGSKLELSQIYQTIWFDFEKSLENNNAFEACDEYRSLLHQISFYCCVKSITPECEQKLKEKYLEQYSELVDGQQGVNNYAETVLALAAHRKNESAEWKSRLCNSTDEELLELIPNSPKLKDSFSDDQNFLAMYSKECECLKGKNSRMAEISIDSPKEFFTKEIQNPESVHDGIAFNRNCSFSNSSVSEYGSTNEIYSSHSNGNFGENSVLISNESSNQTNPTFSFSCNKDDSKSPKSSNFISSFQNHSGYEKVHHRKPFMGQIISEPCKSNYKESATFPNQNKRKKLIDNVNMKSNAEFLPFKTAKEQLIVEQHKKYGGNSVQNSHMVYGNNRKCLGTRRGLNSKFVPPVLNKGSSQEDGNEAQFLDENILQDEKLANIDPKMVKVMLNEIMDHGPPVSWNDIAGLEFAKTTIKEIVVWPILRPDIFTGLRGPPKGILLFGPPGTGKTLIGKCIASQSKSTFFCISSSSLTSKWVGEGEKLVRALFAVARCYQPAVIFIDEIDSLLTQRSDTEHESSRRIKTEFLVQLDGATTSNDERLLIVGATNRPQELDEAARRRLVKRLYIPLPESHARKQIVMCLLANHSHCLSEDDLNVICEKTAGYSGADMANLCKEAALGPIRSINFEHIEHITNDQVRPIVLKDFIDALKQVRASVSDKDLELYAEWNSKYGSGCAM